MSSPCLGRLTSVSWSSPRLGPLAGVPGRSFSCSRESSYSILVAARSRCREYTCGTHHAETQSSKRWKTCGHVSSSSRPNQPLWAPVLVAPQADSFFRPPQEVQTKQDWSLTTAYVALEVRHKAGSLAVFKTD